MKVPIKHICQTLMSTNNCFSLYHADVEYKIVNCKLEPFMTAARKAGLKDVNIEIIPDSNPEPNEFPKYQPASRVFATVNDDRFPNELFGRDWCRVCCPRNLMPKDMQERLK